MPEINAVAKSIALLVKYLNNPVYPDNPVRTKECSHSPPADLPTGSPLSIPPHASFTNSPQDNSSLLEISCLFLNLLCGCIFHFNHVIDKSRTQTKELGPQGVMYMKDLVNVL